MDSRNVLSFRQETDSVLMVNFDVYLKERAQQFKKKHDPIVIPFDENSSLYVYYDDSIVLKNLQIFPFIQLAVVFIFIAVSFLALNSTKKAEQNRVWVGLAKETAHQLGTPISSLMAWVEYLKTKDLDTKLLREMDKDVQHLKTVAERFSKIGSNAEPEPMDLAVAVSHAVEYMGKRISSKVKIKKHFPEETICVLMNESLFGWVIENLIKNAVDAMDGQGLITLSAISKGKRAILDVSDTGKGIPKSKFDAIFQPGYTTKKRGWGLGLSLVRRIIESYHKGKIFVYKSEIGKGTTFRIELRVI
jgi:signal transduction histidine kinase